jgi:hypothetical protein
LPFEFNLQRYSAGKGIVSDPRLASFCGSGSFATVIELPYVNPDGAHGTNSRGSVLDSNLTAVFILPAVNISLGAVLSALKTEPLRWGHWCAGLKEGGAKQYEVGRNKLNSVRPVAPGNLKCDLLVSSKRQNVKTSKRQNVKNVKKCQNVKTSKRQKKSSNGILCRYDEVHVPIFSITQQAHGLRAALSEVCGIHEIFERPLKETENKLVRMTSTPGQCVSEVVQASYLECSAASPPGGAVNKLNPVIAP